MVGSSFAIALTIRSVDGFLSPSLSIRLIPAYRPECCCQSIYFHLKRGCIYGMLLANSETRFNRFV